MTRLYCTPSPTRAKRVRKEGFLPVVLYGSGNDQLAGIGHPVIDECRQLHRLPTTTAWDFLSFALSVVAADSFVKRTDAADGWTREIELTVELLEPEPWQRMSDLVVDTLRFLTGDLWRMQFSSRGAAIPSQKKMVWKDAGCDSVCLFSGGLDSFIGALDLIADGRTPYLVSCAYPKDAEKQAALVRELKIQGNRHFPANPDPRWDHANETSMRARSFLFLSLGVLIASTLREESGKGPTELYLPENGFISLNVPLTARRLGSLSTRTTHPHFIAGVDTMLKGVGIAVRIINPYQLKTKGEMISECKSPAVFQTLAPSTVSCGKWKRKSQQCGRCLPCLIRRAAFAAAGFLDSSDYRFPELTGVDDLEDVLAVRLACRNMLSNPAKWMRRSGPLPLDLTLRSQLSDVFARGLKEVDSFIAKALT